MRITFIGAGYVGLVASACLAEAGHEVVAVDRDPERLSALLAGTLPLYEPGLDELVREVTSAGLLRFSDHIPTGAPRADVVFIAVGTPGRRGDGTADVSTVMDAARALASNLDGPVVVVIKSTVPIGTAENVQRLLDDAGVKAAVVSNPEFLRQGAAVQDCRRPARILLGSPNDSARSTVKRVYAHHTAPVLEMNWRSAELAKYASNAFLAMKVAFVNEMADVCEATGADVQQVTDAMGRDARIGAEFLHASPGFGGSCFPKDTLALARMAEQAGAPSRLVMGAVLANTQRILGLGERVATLIRPLKGKRVGLLGLAFKPGTDDLRGAPAHALIPYLIDHGAAVVAHDPRATARHAFPNVEQLADPQLVAQGADLLVVLTPWPVYRSVDLHAMADSMRQPVLFDLHNFFSTHQLDAAGFRHHGVGRGSPG